MFLIFLCAVVLSKCFARDPPTVTIPNQGDLAGKEISMIRTQRVEAFLGIPYARPPIGNLRFAPPQIDPLPAWEGTRNATNFELPCLQTNKDFKQQDVPFLDLITPPQEGNVDISEDCLYLNVFRPSGASRDTNGYAVIVWIHPGNYTTGNPAIWNPYTLVYRQKIIVVTFAWRMNVMGFLTTMDGEAPGNYGLMDQQAAMMWIKNNIKIFGGNSDNICLMGYGTGAGSIGLHMINPLSQGLFHKAILMSGNFLNPSAVKYPHEDKPVLDDIAQYYSCFRTPTSSLMECLRSVDPISLVTFTSNVDWKPLIDQGLSNSTPPFLSEPPRNLYERGEYHKIPILTGFTNMEDVLALDNIINNNNISNDDIQIFLNDIANRDLPVMNNSLESASCVYNYQHIMDSVQFFYEPSVKFKEADQIRKLITDLNTEKYYGGSTFLHGSLLSKENTTYMYRFDLRPSTSAAMTNIQEWITVPHLFDLIYVWGIPYWISLPGQEWDDRDKRTSQIIMTFWANFAKYTNPANNTPFPIKWEPFTPEDLGILIIDNKFTMSDQSTLNYKAFEFWNYYYPKVVALSTQCCNATNNANVACLLNYNCVAFSTALLALLLFVHVNTYI